MEDDETSNENITASRINTKQSSENHMKITIANMRNKPIKEEEESCKLNLFETIDSRNDTIALKTGNN